MFVVEIIALIVGAASLGFSLYKYFTKDSKKSNETKPTNPTERTDENQKEKSPTIPSQTHLEHAVVGPHTDALAHHHNMHTHPDKTFGTHTQQVLKEEQNNEINKDTSKAGA
jgi:hypothetical protein